MLPDKGQQRYYSGGEHAANRRVAMEEMNYEHYQADVDEVTVRSIGQHDQGSLRPPKRSQVLAAVMLDRSADYRTDGERNRVPDVEVVNQHLVNSDIENQRNARSPDISGTQRDRVERRNAPHLDRKSTRLNSSHLGISYA